MLIVFGLAQFVVFLVILVFIALPACWIFMRIVKRPQGEVTGTVAPWQEDDVPDNAEITMRALSGEGAFAQFGTEPV